MNVLKTYVREIIKEYLYEEAGMPQLPDIPPATGGGAVGRSGARLNKARKKFATTAINYLNQYYQTLMRNRQLDQTTANYLYSITDQILARLRTDTKNWSDIPREIEIELQALKPQNSALANVRENTEWAHEGVAPYNPQELMANYQTVVSNLPQLVSALQAYNQFYNAAQAIPPAASPAAAPAPML